MADITAAVPDTSLAAGPNYSQLGFPDRQLDHGSSYNPLTKVMNRYRNWVTGGLGELPSPGTNETFGKEAKTVLASNYMFDGAKAELQKSISLAPMFQINHAFSLGGQSPGAPGPSPGNYNFAAVVVNDDVLRPLDQCFAQASVEGSGGVFGVMKYDWNKFNTGSLNALGHTTKIQAQLPPMGSMSGIPAQFTFDHEIKGADWAGSISLANPSPTDLSGVYGYSHLQSISKRLALGASAQFINLPSRPDITGLTVNWKARYANIQYRDQSTSGDYIATLEYPAPQQGIALGYWQYLGEKVEAGTELVLGPDMDSPTPGGSIKSAAATVGLKFDYRLATYRGQISSDGKIMAHLEQRLNPLMSFTLCGEIDQWKNTSKFGFSINLEGTSAEDMQRMQEVAQAKQQGKIM